MMPVDASAIPPHGGRELASPDTVAGVIREWVTQTPHAIAIHAPERAPLTYGELGIELARFAAALNANGIHRNDRVALVLPNGPEMAFTFLGVAACATAAPLNPDYRAEEFEFYLSDLNARALIVSTETDSSARQVARARGIPVIEVTPRSDRAAGLVEFSNLPLSSLREPTFAQTNDVALVLHTSGTTARPKIVPLTQANICASAHHIRTALQLGAEDRCLNVMPLFHIHGLMASLLASLSAGGSVICTPGFYAPQFFGWLETTAPTWFTAVPTMHQALLARAPANAGIIARNPLRLIRSSSASLPPQVMEELERVFAAPVIEAYGMTEAAHQMASNPLPPQRRKPGSVGRAAGPEIAIMDGEGNLVAAGVAGEIVVRGPNVTAGYENNASANAAVFAQGWFRTGDEGYLDAEGYLFITGRIKELINRGGEKIAPRELDAVLLDHPAVAEAVTFAMPDLRLGEEVAARDSAASKQEYVAPRTELEAHLADIWCRVLGCERVSIHDDFSELGGDSILAAQVFARVSASQKVELPFLSIFEEAATIAQMSALIERMQQDEEGRGTPAPADNSQASSTAPESGAFAAAARNEPGQTLSYGQQRLWFLDQFEPNSSLYNMHRLIRLTGALNVGALEASLGEIVRRHQVLRATFTSSRDEPRQIIAPYQPFTLPLIDLRHLPLPERAAAGDRVAQNAARQPFDLAHGPLLRALVVQVADQDYSLLLAMHHIVSDGWSMGILLKELTALYDAYSCGKPSPLPELPIQYSDLSLRQRAWLEGGMLNKQLEYWKERLAHAPPVLELPFDHPRPPRKTYRGAMQEMMLDDALVESHAQLGRGERVTLFMCMLAAFQTLLYHYSGQKDIIVGTPVAGRRDVDSEQLIGFFVSTLVLRTDLSGDPTWRELLARVRRVALDAFSNQDVPFEKLVTELRPERNLSRSPVFQVMFQLDNLSQQPVTFAGLKTSEARLDLGVARFDLSFTLSVKPDGLLSRLQYSTDLFEPDSITRMLGDFKTLLEDVLENPDERISRLPRLTQIKRHPPLGERTPQAKPFLHDTRIQPLNQSHEQDPFRMPSSALEAETIRTEIDQLSESELDALLSKLMDGEELKK